MICYDKTEILIKVLGAGQTVGRSCVLVELENRKIIFDCGVHLGFKDERKFPNFNIIIDNNNNNTAYGGNINTESGNKENKEINISIVNSTALDKDKLIKRLTRINDIIDCVIITHFHMDHIGALPFFTETLQFKGPVLMSYPTKALSPILLYDGCKLSDSRWDRKNVDRQMKLIVDNASDFLKFSMNNIKDSLNITEDDIYNCMNRVIGLQINETYQLGDINITPYYAGHVLGACIFKIEVNGFSVIYTGDYNTVPDKHLGSVRIPSENPEILISESTYANYIRPTRKSSELELCNLVHECVNKGGKVLIPVFAIGRAQELSIMLDTYWEKMKINFPIYFGGGLTESANQYYSIYSSWTNSHCVSSKIRKNLFDFKHIGSFMHTYLDENRPMVLFATPGMLHTGLALKAFKSWATDPRNLVVLPGYCVQGTVGNKLLMGEKRIQIDHNTTVDVLCKVIYLSFSAHADSNGIQQLIKHTYPKQVIFVHGEKSGMEKLAKYINKEQSIPSDYPALGQACRYEFQKPTIEYAYFSSGLYKKLMKKKDKNIKKQKLYFLKQKNSNNHATVSKELASTATDYKVMTNFKAFLFFLPSYRRKKALTFFLPRKVITEYLKKKHIRTFLSHKNEQIEVDTLISKKEKFTSSIEKQIIDFKSENEKKRKITLKEDLTLHPKKIAKLEEVEKKQVDGANIEDENWYNQFQSITDFLSDAKKKEEKEKYVHTEKEKYEGSSNSSDSNSSSSSSEEEDSLNFSEKINLPFINLRFKEHIAMKYENFYNFVMSFFQQIIKTKKKKKTLKKFGKQIIIKNIKYKNRHIFYVSFHSLRAIHDGKEQLLLQWSYLDDDPNSTVRKFINSIYASVK